MNFPVHDLETAPAESGQALTRIAKRYGFVPNLAGVFATSPGALHGLLGVLEAFDSPLMKLDSIERQVVLLAVSVYNRCEYCTAAHGMVATHAGLERAELERLQKGLPLSNRRLQALRRFAEVVVDTRGLPSEHDLTEFAAAGYAEAEVLEVVFGVAVKTLTNYVNHIARPAVNEQFAAFVPDWAKVA